MRKLAIAAAAAVAVYSTSASATVTFDPVSGRGTLPKADVVAAFPYDELLLGAEMLFYRYQVSLVTTEHYYVTCEWDQVFGSRTIHRRSGYVTSATVSTVIGATTDIDKSYTFTDFDLGGFGASTTSGLPELGAGCGPYGRGGGAAQVTGMTDIGPAGSVIRLTIPNVGYRDFSYSTI